VRIKFEATDASGKVHKRSSTNHVLFALSLDPFRRAPTDQALAQGHRGLQPRGMGRKAVCWPNARPTRWRKEPHVETVENP